MGVAPIWADWPTVPVVVAAARATNASSSFASTSKNILSLDWSAFLSCSSPWRRPSPTCAGRAAGGGGGQSLSGGEGVGVMRLCIVSQRRVMGGRGEGDVPVGHGGGGGGFGGGEGGGGGTRRHGGRVAESRTAK